jgi:hypothetical protein
MRWFKLCRLPLQHPSQITTTNQSGGQVLGVHTSDPSRPCTNVEPGAKRSATQRRHEQAIQNWKPSDLPGWLTREVYVKQVQPALGIRAGKRIPHARHWQALAGLVGVSLDV